MIKRTLGAFEFLIGIAVLIWISYNFLVERQPGSSVIGAIFALMFSVSAITIGFQWMRGK